MTHAAPGSGAIGPLVSADALCVSYGRHPVLRDVHLTVGAGEVLAVMGRNGAGKSTLLSTLVGLLRPESGRVRIAGADPAALSGPDLVRTAGLVPQDPADLLAAVTVAAECADSDRDAGAPLGTTAAVLRDLAPEVDPGEHPRDLSEGQRLCLALAVVLAGRPPVLLLDEPTRGLDYDSKARLVAALRDLASAGHAVLIATHDVELAADVATRVAVVADGELVADGPAREIVVASPMFAPQVAKIMSPEAWLTVGQVEAALAVAG